MHNYYIIARILRQGVKFGYLFRRSCTKFSNMSMPMTLSMLAKEVPYLLYNYIHAGSNSPCIVSMHAVPPEIAVVDPDPVFSNEPVELVCTVVGGDPPRSITWATSNGTQVYSTNHTAGANVSLSITRYDYGEYICIASNEFGRTSRSVQVQHPGLHSLYIDDITVC